MKKKSIQIYCLLFSLLLSTSMVTAQQTTISGTVNDELGTPLPGASIVEKGTTNGAQTDFDGNFTISVTDANAILVVSYIGFTSQEIPVGQQSTINVTLVESSSKLDEVVVIGYGTKTRKDLTGAIASVSSEEIQQRGVSNLTEAIRGRVPGLAATVSTGPSGNADLRIRGQNSIGATNNPLIILDGQIFYGNIGDINPVDVEKIDFLKDASSAAIFGARSSAGVILITTKKGAKGKTIVNFSSNVGFARLNDRTVFQSPERYIQYRTDAFETSGANADSPEFYRNPSELSAVDINTWRGYSDSAPSGATDTERWFSRLDLNSIELENFLAGRVVDWYDETTQTGVRRDNTISVSGANEKTSHYLSISHVANDGVIVGENFEAIRARMNLETEIKSFFKLGANIQFSQDNNAPRRGSDPGFLVANFNGASLLSPYGSKFNEDGSLRVEPHNDALGLNPFLFENRTKDSRDASLVGNIFADVKLPWGFKYRVNWINSFRWAQNLDFQFTFPDQPSLPFGGFRRNFSQHTWNLDNILTWERQFGEDHKVDLTLLLNAESQETFDQRATNSVFVPTEALGFNQLFFGTNPNIQNFDSAYTADAQMARLNYGYKGKYLLTASIRRDGYSAFGANNRRAVFKAGALAWNVSEENFLENADWIDLLKARVSWGENGNRSIPLYRSFAEFGPVQYLISEEGTPTPVTGFTATRLANPNLKWESTESLNIGLDYSLFSGKLSGSFEYYTSSTTDLLIDRTLPPVSGFESILTNVGELGNTGFEAALNAQLVDKPNFTWNSNLIYSTNRNEIKSLFGDTVDVLDDSGNVIGERLADDLVNGWFIGQPIEVIFDYEIDGVYTTDEADEAAAFGLRPGDFRVVDQNGDGAIDAENDRKFLGQRNPKHRFNWTNNFTFLKDFQLSISLDGQLGHKEAYNGRFGGGTAPGQNFRDTRFNSFDLPYWTPDNQLSDWARIGSANPFGASFYENRSFVRVQNITLGYNFPSDVTEALNISALKISMDLNNVGIFTDWSFFDPETFQVPTNGAGVRQLQNTPSPRTVPFIGTLRLLLTL